jgi:cytochrome bd-type quinol oxidase subunit 2
MPYLVTIALVAIIACLGAALFFMMRAGPNSPHASRKMANALAIRVGLSIALFVCILIAWKLGYIHPTGIAPGQ